METIVTNSHHFCKGIKLTINNETKELIWSINTEQQKYKYGTVQIFNSQVDGIIDPKRSISEFVLLLTCIFEFIGVNPKRYLKSDSMSNFDYVKILKRIYDQPLEHQVKFVHIGTCGCNMGHCGAVTGIDVSESEYRTYGDLMRLFGDETWIDQDLPKSEDNVYYEYPDCVHFWLEQITEFPKVHQGGLCGNPLIDSDITMEKDVVYLAWGFSR